MSIKKIESAVTYSVEMTQDQLDKIYAILGEVDDADTDELFYEMEAHVDDGSLTLTTLDGDAISGLEVS